MSEKEQNYECPECGADLIRLKNKKTGKGFYWMCSEFKEGCKTFLDDKRGKPVPRKKPTYAKINCPKCDSKLRQLESDKGKFWGCTNYPNCKNTLPSYEDEPVIFATTDEKCPKCSSEIKQKLNYSSGLFWSCSNYPNCKESFPDDNGEPLFLASTDIKCPDCDKPLRQIKGPKGLFWGCTGYKEGCEVTFEDFEGQPDIEEAES